MTLRVYAFQAGYNTGQWGWTDDFYYQQDDGAGQLGLLAAAKAFWWARRQGMSVDVTNQFIRIGQLDQTTAAGPPIVTNLLFKAAKPVLLFTPPQLGLGKTGTNAGNLDDPWAAVLATIFAASGSLRRNWLIRGTPVLWNSTVPGDIPAFPSPNLRNWFNIFMTNVLGSGAGAAGAMKFPGSFGMKNLTRPFVPPSTIVDVDVNPQGFLKYYFEAMPPFNPGDPVVIAGLRLSCGKGVNGNTQVKTAWTVKPATDPHEGAGYTTVYKKWCCLSLPYLKTNGTMSYRRQSFTSFDPFTPGGANAAFSGATLRRMVNRKTGRPFDGTRGRGRPCCA